MGLDNYDWRDLAAGQSIEPVGWVLIRRMISKTSGQQWLAARQNAEGILYFPPASLVEDEVLFDEWKRRTQKLIGGFAPEFQQMIEIATHNVHWPFCVMEAIKGKRIDPFGFSIHERGIAANSLREWIEPVIHALESEHRKMNFHASLAPDSFLQNRDGTLRILNHVWRALFCDLEQRAIGSAGSSLSIAYLSPQQLDGRRSRATDDIYSLAATMYEWLASEAPFVRGDLAHQIRHMDAESIAQRLEDLGGNADSIPKSLDAAILQCLSKQPEARFDSLSLFWKKAWETKISTAPKSPQPKDRSVSDSSSRLNIPSSSIKKSIEESPDESIDESPEESVEESVDDESYPGEVDYQLPPPVPFGKRFGVLFVLLIMLVVAGGFAVEHYRNHYQNHYRSLPAKASSNVKPKSSVSKSVPSSALPVSTNVSSLAVHSQPAQVFVELWLDNREIPIEGITPILFSNLPPGRVELRLVRDGYCETNLFAKVELGKTNQIHTKLHVQLGRAALSSEPAGVAYILHQNEKRIRSGYCPDAFALPVGFYRIDYLLGKRRQQSYLRIDADKIATQTIAFEAGKLSIETIPEVAEIFFEEKRIGMTPITMTNLAPGEYDFVLKAPRHRRLFVKASIQHGIETFVSKHLDPMLTPEAKEEWMNSLGMRFVPLSNGNLLGIYEVSEELFRIFAETSSERNQTPLPPKSNVHLPVVNVSLGDALAFCQWLTKRERENAMLLQSQHYRLPSSAEWDLAIDLKPSSDVHEVRHSSFSTQTFGEMISNDSENDSENDSKPNDSEPSPNHHLLNLAPVGQGAPNRFGIFDLAGNVREWCLNEIHSSSVPSHGMVRGASWRVSDPSRLAIDFRESLPQNTQSDDLGFRILLDLGTNQDKPD